MHAAERIADRLLALLTVAALAHVAVGQEMPESLGTNVIVPQRHAIVVRPGATRIAIPSVAAQVWIDGQVATTSLEIALANPGARPEEAVVLLPVPEGAVLRSFGFEGVGPEPTARLLAADEARRIYEDIVRRARDPALLEFAGSRLVRSSAFPVPPGATQRVTLVYEELLPVETGRLDYCLPRSEALADEGTRWTAEVHVRGAEALGTLYSPSHVAAIERQGAAAATARFDALSLAQPGPLRLCALVGGGSSGATVFAWPDALGATGGGGYFLLLANVSAGSAAQGRGAPPREITLVLDRSGSMRGEKLDQAREAARQVIEALAPGDLFNIVDYSDDVAQFAPRPVVVDPRSVAEARAYLDGLRALGGTNIGDALSAALRQPSSAEWGADGFAAVLFLTDGLPTVGTIPERELGDQVRRENARGRRIFAFGVGHDVNAPLLDRIARDSRGTSSFVAPAEDVEVAVARVFRRIAGPVLVNPELLVLDATGRPTTRAVRELQPALLPDVFEGEDLVVLGRYLGSEPVELVVQGQCRGVQRSIRLRLDPARASSRHSFVPRLWASRRIAWLSEEIRQAGAAGPEAARRDPRFAELVGEIVELSTRHGILSEYTAFLALEPAHAGRLPAPVMAEVARERAADAFVGRAVEKRDGAAGASQAKNLKAEMDRTVLNPTNAYRDDDMQVVSQARVQQLPGGALFQRGTTWVDARLVIGAAPITPERVIEFASPEYFELAQELAREGRQSALALGVDVLLLHAGQRVLVRAL